MTSDHEKELIHMWQESTAPGPLDAGELARSIAARVDQFDRKIRWRNVREYVAGGLLIVWFLWLARIPSGRAIAIAGIVAVGFVMIYLWRSQRATPTLDPTSDATSYRKALLDRYDHQIGLLRRVKYWYVLPMYLWMLLVLVSTPSPASIPSFLLITLFAGFVVWLNESYGVRKLQAARKEAESLLQNDDGVDGVAN